MAKELVVVDMSHHQADPIDFAAMKAGGIVGVGLKATEGTSYVDPTYRERKQKALDAGMKVFSYHFFHGGNIDQQMAHFVDTVQPKTGERLVIDHEADASLEELRQAVEFLMNTTGAEITIYSGHTIKDQLGTAKDNLLADNTSLWIAQYTTAASPSWPKGTWPAWSLWQYTDKATVPGFNGPIDGNRFNGTAENAAKWIGPVEAVPEPVPPPEPVPEPRPDISSPVVVSVQAPPGIQVQLVVNGNVIE